MSASHPKTLVTRRFGAPGGLLFGLLWAVWALGRWPAFFEPFWIADDFSMWDLTFTHIAGGGAGQGRWLNGPWYALYFLFPPPAHLAGSIVLRALAGLLHTLSSWLMGKALVRATGTAWAWLAVLPFHLWAFNGEATIWFAGSTYALAGALTIGGVALLHASADGLRRPLAAALLIALGVNSNQAGAMGGAAFGLVLAAVEAVRTPSFDRRRWARLAAATAAGYLLGGVASAVGMLFFGYGRAGQFSDFGGMAAQYLKVAERLWLFPGIYPPAYVVALALLLFGTAALLLAFACRQSWRRAGLAALALGLLTVAAIAPSLLAAESAAPPRVLYAASLVWVGLASVAFTILPRGRPRIGGAGLLLILAALNLPLSIREAAEFSTIYRRDLQTLRELEAYAAAVGCERVLFMDWTHSAPWRDNPYELALYYRDTIKAPVFQQIAWGYRFIDYYSETLENVPWWPMEPPPNPSSQWDRLRARYQERAQALPRDHWIHFEFVPEADLILVVPR